MDGWGTLGVLACPRLSPSGGGEEALPGPSRSPPDPGTGAGIEARRASSGPGSALGLLGDDSGGGGEPQASRTRALSSMLARSGSASGHSCEEEPSVSSMRSGVTGWWAPRACTRRSRAFSLRLSSELVRLRSRPAGTQTSRKGSSGA